MQKKLLPSLTILVLTIYIENELIFDALYAGASGYLVKNTPPIKLMEAIKDAYLGGTPMNSNIAKKVLEFFQQKKQFSTTPINTSLSISENEILNKLVEGENFKAISDSLAISKETVRENFKSIYKKLHLSSQKSYAAKIIK